ncbi:MAG: TlpA family protein disulfide reductase [Nitrospirota bacterium]
MAGFTKISWATFWLLLISASPGLSVEVGEPAPDFAVQTFDGARLSRATLAGKPAMIVFWNTWCPECLTELPRINRLVQRFGPEGLEILAINTGLNDSESKARAYWKKYGYVFPTGFDQSFEIGHAFRLIGVPMVFLVDTRGVVRYKNTLVPDDIEAWIKKLQE